MKKFFMIALMLGFSATSFALQEKDLNVQGGAGAYGSRGLFGVSIDRFFTPHHALSGAFGVDPVGAVSTVGYKYFSDSTNTTGTIWDKCFLLIECQKYLYGGLGIQYASSTKIKITESGEVREYTTDPKWLGIASIGTRSVFKNNITLDLELTYRSIATGGESYQTAGLPADDNDLLEMGYRSWGFGIALGYMF